MIILSIDTSCDETSVAITEGRNVLSNVIYSQVLIHKQWGGVVPSLAKRAHEERIDWVIAEALRKYKKYSGKGWDSIDCIAVTQGPGLAMALEIGIQHAKELVEKHNKKLITVNHLEGHIYSSYIQNRNGNPKREICFPCLALIVSGGHTELVYMEDHLKYQTLGSTIDDAAGEALDKAAKMLGLGYPGGAVIEQLASEGDNKDVYHFPRPMVHSKDLRFSFSGLKTSLFYFLKKMDETEKIKQLRLIASSYQEAVFQTIVKKTALALEQTQVKHLIVGGGVIANKHLREMLRNLMKEKKGTIYFPPFSYLTGDNAAMIGIVAYYKAKQHLFVKEKEAVDRIPRMSL